jgi:hypothetical protein
MKKSVNFLANRKRLILLCLVVITGLGWLFLYRLGSLTGGLSGGEYKTVTEPLGWHNLYQQPLYLPIKLVRSVVFWLEPDHGQLLSRLPNVLFGALAVAVLAWLVRLWHGNRTAWLAGLLFATSAWTLHVSRLASYDVLYLLAIPALLLVHLGLQKQPRPGLWYLSNLLNGLVLYVPGLVWLVLLNAYMQRRLLASTWRQFNSARQRAVYVLAGLIWLPLLIIDLTRAGHLKPWLGMPDHLAGPLTLLKQLATVPMHLFIRGPQYPDLWLGRTPVLDVFTLIVCLVGIYFYLTRLDSARSRLLAGFFILGAVLIGLGGPVSLSLLVPILYLAAATGIAYLLRDWLKVFPLNPVARGVGLGLIFLAVGVSCVYNLRAYFIAWPHNSDTKAAFRYRL